MKRAKKSFWFLAGILLLLGFCFREDVLASSLTSLPSLSKAGIGEVVSSDSVIDGRYDFTPLIGSETKIRFGSTDGSTWDNLFCKNGESHSKCCSTWWPAADVKGWSNLRSFTPLESKKGKMYAEYTNVGECHGENITMRIWLEDWQNTVVPSGYEDVDAVVVAIDHNKPVIDIKGLLWIKVRFAYYDSKGNPLNVKGYFTLSDLDFKQGFYLADETEHIYLTKEADARIVYDARTEAIWSARRGSEPDGGTTPENSEGWVTFTFEGNSQTMIFYDGGTNDAVTGPGGGVKAPKKWPDNFVNDTSSTYNNWHGASRETGITVVPWNTSEFGYTANVPCHLSKVGDLVVKKMDAETKEAISGAEFTVYRWKNNTWSEFKKMNWVKKTGSYLLEGILDTDSENGKFRVVETKNPAGYAGSWEQEFSIDKEGMQTIHLEAENTRKTGSLKIKKTEENSGKALSGATYQVIASGAITTVNGTVLFPDQAVAAVLKTDENGEAFKDGLEYGTYLVRETAAPNGYVLDPTEKKITIGEQNAQITLTFTNWKNRFVLQIKKTEENSGKALSGATYQVIASGAITTVNGTVLFPDQAVAAVLKTDENGEAFKDGLEYGTYLVRETAAPNGYVLDPTEKKITIGEQNAQITLTFTNWKNRFVLQKVSQGDGKVLQGAAFHIWTKDGSFDETKKTDANGKIELTGLLDGVWYYQETASPEGYLLDSTCREFVVENGKIDGKSELSVTVENDGTHLTIEKIDAESGKRISGAKLVLKDMDGNRVDSWISGGSGPHELEKLKPGSYVLVEEAAPDGYLAAEPVSFVLEAKQEVQTVTMKDLACETLTITKKIKADEITWAHGNPTFLFSVKGKDLYGKEHTYQCYLTFTKTQVEKTTDQDGYTEQSVQIRGIPAGNDYRVQEKKVLRYSLMQVTGTKNVTVKKLEEPAYGKDPARVFSVSVNLCGHPKESEVVFENQKYRWDDYGHNSIVKNRIPVE